MFLALALLFAQPPAPAAGPVVTPERLPDAAKPTEVKTAVGVPVRLTSDKDGTRWEVGCAAGKRFYLIPDPGGLKATVIAADPGRFTVLTIGSSGPATHTVIVAGEPDPAPPPAPVPPPPLPVPVPPPAPADPFVTAVRIAFAADTEPGKAAKAGTLAMLYGQAAEYALDETLSPTAEALNERVKQASVTLKITVTDLATVRTLVKAELAAAAGNAPLDAAARKKLADVYRRAAAGLSQ